VLVIHYIYLSTIICKYKVYRTIHFIVQGVKSVSLYLITYIQPFFGPHAVWYVSYQSLSRSWRSDLHYGSYRSSNMEIGLTTAVSRVTGQQGMLTPPWHLTSPLIYSEVRVRPFSDLYVLWNLWDWLQFVIFFTSCTWSISRSPCIPIPKGVRGFKVRVKLV
jgi:hypothetical protein